MIAAPVAELATGMNASAQSKQELRIHGTCVRLYINITQHTTHSTQHTNTHTRARAHNRKARHAHKRTLAQNTNNNDNNKPLLSNEPELTLKMRRVGKRVESTKSRTAT